MTLAHKNLRHHVDRVLRLKKQQDDLGEDIKQVYAEAHAQRIDKTAMGKVVNHLRRHAKAGAKAQVADATFEEYLLAYEHGTDVANNSSGAHPHAGEEPQAEINRRMTALWSAQLGKPLERAIEEVRPDLPPHDEDGVIIEPASAPPDAPRSDQPSIPAHRFRDGGLSAVIGPSRDGRADEFGKEDENSSNLSDVPATGPATAPAPGAGGDTITAKGDAGEKPPASERPTAASLANPAAGAAEQGLGTAPNSMPGPDLNPEKVGGFPVAAAPRFAEETGVPGVNVTAAEANDSLEVETAGRDRQPIPSDPGTPQASDGRLTKQETGDPVGSEAASAGFLITGKSPDPIAPIPGPVDEWADLDIPALFRRTAA